MYNIRRVDDFNKDFNNTLSLIDETGLNPMVARMFKLKELMPLIGDYYKDIAIYQLENIESVIGWLHDYPIGEFTKWCNRIWHNLWGSLKVITFKLLVLIKSFWVLLKSFLISSIKTEIRKARMRRKLDK